MLNIAHYKLSSPLLQAPMAGVTDRVYRDLVREHGAGMATSEMVTSDLSLISTQKTQSRLPQLDECSPRSVQIVGTDPKTMPMAAQLYASKGAELIDINFGCPVKKVACKGAGAALLQNIPMMVKMTKAVVDATELPVTVKTRLGWDEDTKYIVEVAERLQDVGIQAISIHGRTRKQMYKGEADWSLIAAVKENARMNIPVFGNGDVFSPEIALEKRQKYGVDGVMIGRASIGYPWIFREIKHFFATGEHLTPPSMAERIEAAERHLEMSVKWKGERVGINEMRRHYTNYFKGIPNFKEHRMKLVTQDSYEVIKEVFEEIKANYSGEEMSLV